MPPRIMHIVSVGWGAFQNERLPNASFKMRQLSLGRGVHKRLRCSNLADMLDSSWTANDVSAVESLCFQGCSLKSSKGSATIGLLG
jgi:hypothetical protein